MEVVYAEQGQIRPKDRRRLEESGRLVVVVPDINKIKISAESEPQLDDGFNLDETA